jgi:hypothetical protein
VRRCLPAALAVLLVVTTACHRSESAQKEPRFRRITASDYCNVTTVYARPKSDYKVGQLFGEYRIYVDPLSREKSEAIYIIALVNGERRGLWRRKSEVLRWYVVDGPSPETCRWLTHDDVPMTSMHEVHASEELIHDSRGRWRVKRKIEF